MSWGTSLNSEHTCIWEANNIVWSIFEKDVLKSCLLIWTYEVDSGSLHSSYVYKVVNDLVLWTNIAQPITFVLIRVEIIIILWLIRATNTEGFDVCAWNGLESHIVRNLVAKFVYACCRPGRVAECVIVAPLQSEILTFDLMYRAIQDFSALSEL